jgi:anti-sigma factor RsiW
MARRSRFTASAEQFAMPPALTCHEFLFFLGRYVNGELEDVAVEVFHAHLEHCPECVEAINDHGLLIHLAHVSRHDPMAPLAGEVPAALVEAVAASRAVSCC